MVGFVFFPASPRNISFETARALGSRVKGRARKVALTVDADDTLLASIVEALKPDMLQLHGHETPQRVAAVRESFGLPVMKALAIEAKSDLRRSRFTPASPIACCSTRGRRATRHGPAGSASRSTGICWKISTYQFLIMLSGGLNAGQCRRGAAHHARRRRRCFFRRRKRARREGSGQDPRLHPRGARVSAEPSASRHRMDAAHERVRSSPIPSAPARTSAGISASMAGASSPRR